MWAFHSALLLVLTIGVCCQGHALDVERRLDVSVSDEKRNENARNKYNDLNPYGDDAIQFEPPPPPGGAGGDVNLDVDIEIGDIDLDNVDLNLDMGDIDLQDIFDGLYMLFGNSLGNALFPTWDSSGWWNWSNFGGYGSYWNGWSAWNGLWGWSNWGGIWSSDWGWNWGTDWGWNWGSDWSWNWSSDWNWNWGSDWGWISNSDWGMNWSSDWNWSWGWGNSGWSSLSWSSWNWSSWNWSWNWSSWNWSSWASSPSSSSSSSSSSSWGWPWDSSSWSYYHSPSSKDWAWLLDMVPNDDAAAQLADFTWPNVRNTRAAGRGTHEEERRGAAEPAARDGSGPSDGKRRQYSLVSALLRRLIGADDAHAQSAHNARMTSDNHAHSDECQVRVRLVEPEAVTGTRTYSNKDGCGLHIEDTTAGGDKDLMRRSGRSKRSTSSRLQRLLRKYAAKKSVVHDTRGAREGARIVDDLEDRIVGGDRAYRGQFPWMVALIREGQESASCGASLIGDQWVLTAAHCVAGEDERSMACQDSLTVRIGEYNMRSDAEHVLEFTPEAVYMHAGYKSNTVENDIALIKLPQRVDLRSSPYIREACLPTSQDFLRSVEDQDMVYVAGWGVTSWDSDETSPYLRYVRTPIVSHQACSERKAYGPDIRDGMVCAGYMRGGRDSCQGDSGGPLMYGPDENEAYTLVGCVSWGDECAARNHPGVYTDVSYFIDWVRQVMTTED